MSKWFIEHNAKIKKFVCDCGAAAHLGIFTNFDMFELIWRKFLTILDLYILPKLSLGIWIMIIHHLDVCRQINVLDQEIYSSFKGESKRLDQSHSISEEFS